MNFDNVMTRISHCEEIVIGDFNDRMGRILKEEDMYTRSFIEQIKE